MTKWAIRPIEINVNLYLTQHYDDKVSQKLIKFFN